MRARGQSRLAARAPRQLGVALIAVARDSPLLADTCQTIAQVVARRGCRLLRAQAAGAMLTSREAAADWVLLLLCDVWSPHYLRNC
jgi:hypothetical protein